MKTLLCAIAILLSPHLSYAGTESLPVSVRVVLSQYGWQPDPDYVPHRLRSSDRCAHHNLHALVSHYSNHFDLDENLVYAVIYQESRCNTKAISKAGAVGLMQLMPQWGAVDAIEWLTGVRMDRMSPELLEDPHLNVLLGTAYLRLLINTFQDVPEGEARDRVVLASYNWGPTRVRNLLPETPLPDVWAYRQWTTKIPVYETRDYVTRIVAYRFALAQARGF